MRAMKSEDANAEHRILIVDDDETVAAGLEALLEMDGWKVHSVGTAPAAYRAVAEFQPDIILLDLNLHDVSGLDVLEQIKAFDDAIGVVMISGHGTIDVAVKALQRGASSFLPKPYDGDQLRLVLAQTLETLASQRQLEALRRSLPAAHAFIGASESAATINRTIEAVAGAATPVLIEGETGTGKRVIARAIHEQSPRAHAPFVEFTCTGVSGSNVEAELFGYERGTYPWALTSKRGLFEIANGGTIFLKQISELPLEIQSRIVAALDERAVTRAGGSRPLHSDIRLIAGSRRALADEVRKGRLRDDLFYRINVVRIVVPPLRDRSEDITSLAEWLLTTLSAELGLPRPQLAQSATAAILSYGWPGNARELRNALERAVLLSRGAPIRKQDLRLEQGNGRFDANLKAAVIRPLEDVTADYIRHAVEIAGGNIREAARRLEISPSTLYARMKNRRNKDDAP